jgi:hypothetical protein
MNYATALLLGLLAMSATAETMDDYLQRKQAKLEAGIRELAEVKGLRCQTLRIVPNSSSIRFSCDGVLYHMFEDSDDAEGFVIVRAK